MRAISPFLARPDHTWIYRARILRVIDGDTMEVLIDVGFHGTQTEQLRLLGVNAPETRGPERPRGLEATAWVTRWVEAHRGHGDWPFLIQTERDDAFGRYLAVVWAWDEALSLNAQLVAAGQAVIDERG